VQNDRSHGWGAVGIASARSNRSDLQPSLAEPGILLDMVGHDQIGLHRGALPGHGSGRRVYVYSLLGLMVSAAAIGVFFAGVAIESRIALESGRAGPASSWLRSSQQWLPWLCVGFGFSRFADGFRRGRWISRLAAIALLFCLATAHAVIGGAFAWLPGATACTLGLVLGLRSDAAQRAGWVGVVVAGLAAACAAFGVVLLPTGWGLGASQSGCLGLVLLLVLAAVSFDGPAGEDLEAAGRPVWQVLAGWVVVFAAMAYIATQSGPADWVVMSAFCAVVATAFVGGRLALALGAAAAMSLITAGVLPGIGAAGGAYAGGDRATVAAGLELAQRGRAGVFYFRDRQELQLTLDGEVVAAAGPDRVEGPLLAAFLHAAAYDGDRVLWLGSGAGRAAASLRRAERCEVEAVVAWPELAALQSAYLVDGPVLPPTAPAAASEPTWSRALSSLPDGSRQVLVVSELPTSSTAYRATVAFQRQLRRIAGDGLICQPIALDRVSGSLLESWLRVVRDVHPWSGIYAVGNAAVLVSSTERPRWRRRGFADWCEEARWAMHAAHLGGPRDLDVAFLGAVKASAGGAARGGGGQDVAELLMRWLTIPAFSAEDLKQDLLASRPSESAVLRRWQRHQSDVSRAKGRLLALPDTAEGRQDAQAIAAQFLPMGAPAPWLQAALGLAGPDGVVLRDSSLASRCAYGMDPTFFQASAPVFASLPRPNQPRGDLEGLWRLGDGERLVQRCSGNRPQAVALRMRFGSRCARSLMAALRNATLDPDVGLALRELADPFVLMEASRVLVPQGRWRELLTFWRGDLPCPHALLEIAERAGLEDRLALASALRGRRDPSCYPVIAVFLASEELELRKVAAEALRMAVGERVPFEAHWPRSRRLDAARELRVLHNRKP